MRARRLVTAAAATAVGALLVGCTQSDRSELVTWTDEHGRACTGVVIIDSEDGDREMSSLDCDYAPDGRQPGRTTTTPVPR
ncbi:hypothetical protein OYE22_21480 [Streptomyces sp. 71268]|uniref:hypothetical protein n=1 Tax=Streptomyces sp. 71268 TaxID=3002640 RepID=UPI0023FA4106|nr:hypothetical protein [Streptomyces sp. 71268]WEV27474.1 hypothetical protein OYE22_21480 [Streptomyces sp. 71268]